MESQSTDFSLSLSGPSDSWDEVPSVQRQRATNCKSHHVTKDLEQSELIAGRQSVDAGGQWRPEGAGHVVKGAVKVRVDVPCGVVVARDVQ